ncbi:hypothetical protein NP233_g2602 [Leucocoprinus birnbaumii]|uniref:Queuosine 5'-phosphate N-glycosylase/hydrolase n=1 Tax=Leucocoprinus birnbaumii TaxID=56174 RepID=A0AAD5VYN9_9AGAR|nr:hypothetical protein NP233_g2602 [Leucocoprinus birnbaumii]
MSSHPYESGRPAVDQSGLPPPIALPSSFAPPTMVDDLPQQGSTQPGDGHIVHAHGNREFGGDIGYPSQQTQQMPVPTLGPNTGQERIMESPPRDTEDSFKKVPFKEQVIGVAQLLIYFSSPRVSRFSTTFRKPVMSVIDCSERHSLLDFDSEKLGIRIESESEMPPHNPVIESSEYAYKATDLVKIDDTGVKVAANYGTSQRYGVEWYASWAEAEKPGGRRQVFTGYWSLVASLDRALWEEDIPFVNPEFYSSETLCPESLIEHVFRPTPESTESMPLIRDRIRIMRENGSILCNVGARLALPHVIFELNYTSKKTFRGSFEGFIDEFHRRYHGQGSALDLVKMVTETFPSFKDQVSYEGRTVCFWKRAQILVAELWAAFYPESPGVPHPLFPSKLGPRIDQLTMFADYRVPQILHHLRILDYPPSLMEALHSGTDLMHGCREEVSLRAASIVAVERVREHIVRSLEEGIEDTHGSSDLENHDADSGVDGDQEVQRGDGKRDYAGVSSVLIDFYLWDLAKRIESGEEKVDGIETAEMAPIHHTRSIWY